MNYLNAKGFILPIVEGLETLQRVLSENEVRKNIRLPRQTNKLRIRVAELRSILQRLKIAEKKEKNL